ncbi:MAG: sugar ABC transporter substrate-binding protein [Eubacteriales bacterium]|nr:sugar ABC transporter substrate-binding protein [Eubacteriales bacterium]
MQRILKRAGVVGLLFLYFILICTEKTRAEDRKEELRCIAFYSSVNGVNSTISYVTQSILENLGEEDAVSLSVYCLPSDLYESMDYKVKTAVAFDMDVMIVADIPEEADVDILRTLQDENIFVLAVDGHNSSYEQSASIGTGNRSAGVQAAQMIAERVGNQQAGMVATSFRNSKISGSRRERQVGFVEEAENHQNLQVKPECICSSDTLEAMQTVRKYLDENPGINVMYCLDSASGVTVSKVLAEQGRTEDVYVLCFDYTEQVRQEMQQGGIDAVIVQNPEKTGQECAEFLRKIVSGTDIEELIQAEITVPCKIIDLESAEDAGSE